MDTKLIKQKILDLAIRGKLVPQNPADEAASILLERIKAEKAKLIKEGKIKKEKPLPPIEEVPFEIPESWEWGRLQDIILGITAGKSYKCIETPPEDNWPGIVKVSAATWGEFKEEESKTCPSIDNWVEEYAIKEGDFLITRANTDQFVGACVVVNKIKKNLMLSDKVLRISFIDKVQNLYMLYCLRTSEMRKQIVETATGTSASMKNISQDAIRAYSIPLPPLAEQKRIVAEIDRWFKWIDELEKNQQDLHTAIQQAKSKILDLAIHGKLVPQESEWKESAISDLCVNISGLWKGKKEPFINVGVIRNANFTKDFKLDYSKIEYIDVEEKSFKKRHLKNGDLIVEKSGGSDQNPVGRAILYEGPDEKYSYSNFTMILRINNANFLHYKYLYYYILNRYKSGDMKQMQTQTTGLHNLILDKYLAMNVPLPLVNEQKCIVSKIEELFTQLDKIEESLN